MAEQEEKQTQEVKAPVKDEQNVKISELPESVQAEIRSAREEAERYRKSLRTAESKLSSIEEEKKTQEAKLLQEQGNYKALFERSEADKNKNEERIKRAEIRLALQEAGAIDSDLDSLVPMTELKMDSVREDAVNAVNLLKSKKPHLFEKQPVKQSEEVEQVSKTTTGQSIKVNSNVTPIEQKQKVNAMQMNKKEYAEKLSEELFKARKAWNQ